MAGMPAAEAIAEHVGAQRIANQNDVYSGFVLKPGGGIVVGGQGGDLPSLILFDLHMGYRNF